MDGHELNRLRHARIAQCIQEMNALCDEVASLRKDIAQSEDSGQGAPSGRATPQSEAHVQPTPTTLYGVPSTGGDLKRQA